MSSDDTLRDALRGDAGNGGTPDDAWANVRTHAGAIERHRRVVRGGIAGFAAAALIGAVLFAAGTFRDDEHTIATNPPTEQIVAVQGPNNGGDHLVVLDATDGHVIRTLADDIGITFGGISATPDGQTIYFGRHVVGPQCDRVEVAKVSSDGGPVEVVGSGMSPLVSPDGRTLVYVRSPADDPCAVHSEIVRRDLVSGEESVAAITEVRDGVAVPRFPVAWSPDSTRLVWAVCCSTEWWSSLYVEPIGSPDQVVQVDQSPDIDGTTYLPNGRILVAIEDQEPSTGAQLHRLVAFDDATGESVEPVFESNHPGVLHITANSSGDVLMHFGGYTLQRWHLGDTGPVTIAHDIRDATWLPATHVEPPPPEPTTTTTQIPPVLAPNQMLVATTDHQLEVLGSNGTAIRRLGDSGQDIPWIAIAPDGKAAYYEQGTLDPCDADGEIDTVRLDVYPPAFSGGLAGTSPALSADGTKLAYRYGACGGEFHVRDLASGAERVWTLGYPNDDGPLSVELVGPVGWDADNEHVIVQVNRDDTTEFWYVHTGSDTGVLVGPQLPKRGIAGQGGPVDFAPLNRPGYWATVHDIGLGDPFLLSDYFAPGGNGTGTLAKLPAGTVTIVGSATTGQHLLLLVGSDLYRWSEGEASLTLVAHNITAADW